MPETLEMGDHWWFTTSKIFFSFFTVYIIFNSGLVNLTHIYIKTVLNISMKLSLLTK